MKLQEENKVLGTPVIHNQTPLEALQDYIQEERCFLMEASHRDEAIEYLVHNLCELNSNLDENELKTAVIEREKIASTGMGSGIAIPHARLSSYDDFYVALGVLNKGVIWNPTDPEPVRIIFLIAGPDDKQSEYLDLLAHLTFFLRDAEKRNKLLTLSSSSQMIQLFKS